MQTQLELEDDRASPETAAEPSLSLSNEIALLDQRIADAVEKSKQGESLASWKEVDAAIRALLHGMGRHIQTEIDDGLARLERLTDSVHTRLIAEKEINSMLELRRKLVSSEMKNRKAAGEVMDLKEVNEMVQGICEIIADEVPDAMSHEVFLRMRAYLHGDRKEAEPRKLRLK